MARLKWMLDFTRVDLALQNVDNKTHNLDLVRIAPPQIDPSFGFLGKWKSANSVMGLK